MKNTILRATQYLFVLIFCLFIQSILSAHNFSSARPDEIVAIATSISGKAVTVQAGKEKELTIGQELVKGITIKVNTGKVSIVFLNGDFIDVDKSEELTLGVDAKSSTLTTAGTQRGLGANDITSVSGTTINVSESVQRLSQLAQISSVRGEAKAIAISPRLVVSTTRPAFLWFDTDSAARGKMRNYTIIIHDSNNKEIYRKGVRGKVFEMNSFLFPKNQKVIKTIPGQRYSWAVFEKGKEIKTKGTFDAVFSYADAVGLEQTKSYIQKYDALIKSKKIDMSSYNMMLGLHFADEHERLFADALPYFVELARVNPTQSYPFEQLAFILNKFGNEVTPVAQYYSARARSFAQK